MLPYHAQADWIAIVTGLVAGGIGGGAYFGTLLMNLRWYAHRGVGVGVAVALQVFRYGMLGLMLYGLARLGPAALLGGLAGVVLARHIAIRQFEPHMSIGSSS